MPTPAEIEELLNVELTPWQRELLDRISKVNGQVVIVWPRWSGKKFLYDTLTELREKGLWPTEQKEAE